MASRRWPRSPPAAPVDVVLSDWNMPEMNGLEFVKALRADPKFARVVVVMVTTETHIEQMMIALEAGANEYIMKPFTAEMVEDKLRMLQGGRLGRHDQSDRPGSAAHCASRTAILNRLGRKIKVLVVDDSVVIRRIITESAAKQATRSLKSLATQQTA